MFHWYVQYKVIIPGKNEKKIILICSTNRGGKVGGSAANAAVLLVNVSQVN